MAERNYLVSTTGISTTASGTTIGSGNTQAASFTELRKMVRTGIGAGAFSSGSQTWKVYVVVSATSGLFGSRFRLQRLNSSGTVQSSSSYTTAYEPITTGTYDENVTWDSGTWAENDQLALSWEGYRTSGTGNKTATLTANGDSYIDAPTPTVAPTVTTQAVSSIAGTTATGNGNVTSDGGADITERGIVINTTGTPTTSDTKFTSAGTTGAFTASLTSLSQGQLYYARAYAINSEGTSYGGEVSFTTLDVPSAISNLSATGGIEKIDLAWSAPANGGSAITGYKIYRDETATATTLLDTTTELAYEDESVVAGTTYYYRVKATNAIGDSAFSNEDSGEATVAPTLKTPTAAKNGKGGKKLELPVGVKRWI
jgi:hypothetical protein